MTPSPSVSVAMATHNGASFVAEQVRSILAQSHPIDELVVSDDASTDDTTQIVIREVEQCRARNPGSNVELILLRNDPALGVTSNFERAMLACSGSLIALSDQDDRWSEHKLRDLVADFDSDRALSLVATDANLVDAAGALVGTTLFAAIGISPADFAQVQSGDGFAALMRRNVMTGATMVFRRSLLEVAAPFPVAWLHDEWLAAMAAATGSIRLRDEQLIDYRQHGANQVGASVLSLREKLGRLSEPRQQRNAALVARAQALVDRLESLGPVGARQVDLARGKLAHEQVRFALPRARFRRIAPVVREVAARGYRNYGRGAPDVLRDLLQPDR